MRRDAAGNQILATSAAVEVFEARISIETGGLQGGRIELRGESATAQGPSPTPLFSGRALTHKTAYGA